MIELTISGLGIDSSNNSPVVLLKEKSGERDCYVVKSAPKAGDADYSHRLSWIDKTTFLPVKEEYYDQKGELYRLFTAEEIKEVDGLPTITRRMMKNLQSGHATEVTYTRVEYNIGIEDALFSERFMRQPPKKWTE